MTPMQSNFWDQIKSRIASKISPQDFQNWFMRTCFEGADGKILRVTVPDQVTKDWMEQEYAEEIRHSIRELNLEVDRIVYLPGAAAFAAPAPSENGGLEPIFASASGQLNPKFRFDNYVVGSSNQFAQRRGASRRQRAFAQLQPSVHLRRSRHGENALDARHRARSARSAIPPCASFTRPASDS